MKLMRALTIVLTLAILGGIDRPSLASDEDLQFLHAMQQNGYGDMAVEQLKTLKAESKLPPELKDTWDLEMSKSLKAAASTAFDAKEHDALIEESQTYLKKFIKEKPDHPDATVAMATWGDFLMKQSLDSLQLAKAVEGKDKAKHAKLLADARKGLKDAQNTFQEVEKKFKARLAELPAAPKKAGRRARANDPREQAATNLQEARFQLALLDYYLAQTYTDPKSPERTAALTKAAKTLDEIYQPNRQNLTGLLAHMWHGKTVEELGDLQTATDIYDEVLAGAPDPNERSATSGLEPLFTQVEYFRLKILAKQKPQQFLPEALGYLKEFQRFRNTEGYQGIVLDTARALLAAADKASGAEKTKMMGTLQQIVVDGSKVRSQYQRDLYEMRSNLLKGVGRNLEIKTFDDGVAAGDAALQSSEWQQAVTSYGKALEIAQKTNLKNPVKIGEVREAIGRAQFMIAAELFDKGKLNECIELVNKIVRDSEGNVKKESAAAAQASVLGVRAALFAYASAPDNKKKAEARDLVLKMAETTEKNWPDKPEADDSRMARAQLLLANNQTKEGIDVFDRVNPKSERYAQAMYWAGQSYWRLYLIEKLRTDAQPNKEQMEANRTKAVERLSTALANFRKQQEPGKPAPKYMPEAQLLLAEAYYDANDAKQAAAMFQPLVDAIKAEKPQSFDANTIRTFLGAVRAYCDLNDLEKAGAVSEVLITLGPDTPQVNDVLMKFVKLLNEERKKADARVTELESGTNAAEIDAAKKRLSSVQTLLGKSLAKVSPRKELGIANKIFIGETLATVGMTDEATALFQDLIKRTETDEEFAKTAEKAMNRIRSDLIMTLRKQEKYGDALEQVDALIEKYPNALPLLMERGRILEAWADKDTTKFKDAVEHWSNLRNRLQKMSKKPKEIYEVMFNVANCLVREAEKATDKAQAAESANKAEKVLNSALILSPKLDGPDRVAKYKALKDKAIALQGRKPDEKAGEK